MAFGKGDISFGAFGQGYKASIVNGEGFIPD